MRTCSWEHWRRAPRVTCQLVAANMGIATGRIAVRVEGDLDLRGTMGVDPASPVGFTSIRLRFDVDAPGTDDQALESLREKTARYCVVLATLRQPPPVDVSWT